MPTDSAFALALAIGVVAGLRSLTAPAAVSWAAWMGWIDLDGSPLSLLGSTVAVVGLSLLAVAEYVADLLPSTPSRTTAGPLIARIVLGAVSGAALTAAARSPLAGALLGAAGGLIGAFAGYQVRTRLVAALRIRDKWIGLAEDLAAIVLAFVIVSR